MSSVLFNAGLINFWLSIYGKFFLKIICASTYKKTLAISEFLLQPFSGSLLLLLDPMAFKTVPKAACDPESCSESRLWPWKWFRKPPVILKVFPKAACWTWKLFQMPPMILKIVSNAACDPENCPNATCVPIIVPHAACESKSCSKCRLWFLKLFRMPPVILKIVREPPVILKVVPKVAYDIILANYSISASNDGWTLGKIVRWQRREAWSEILMRLFSVRSLQLVQFSTIII